MTAPRELPICPYPDSFISDCPVSGHTYVPGEDFPRHTWGEEATPQSSPEERIDAVRKEMIRELIIPQLERFTAWLESRGIRPMRVRPGSDSDIDTWTWPELMQEWYREMEAFS